MRTVVLDQTDLAVGVSKTDELLTDKQDSNWSESGAGTSEDSMAGTQYWRIRSPIGVPGSYAAN